MVLVILATIAIAVIVTAVYSEQSQTERQIKWLTEDVSVDVRSEIREEPEGYWLYLNDEKEPAMFGVVYQPVPEGKHINDYKDRFGELYKSLLDEDEGGQGHARVLYHMGIRAIRIYDITIDDEDDVQDIKYTFRRIYEQYGIRVLVGNWVGLYSDVDFQNYADRERVKKQAVKMIDIYYSEPWILGWQIGNENNYYVEGGKFEQRINLSIEDYYRFMDEVAGVMRERLEFHGAKQFITLGNGDLTLQEADLISKMRNIDALSINCFRNPVGVEVLLTFANSKINLPVIISEIGFPATTKEEEYIQSRYFTETISILYNNIAGRFGMGNVLMAFICEATDESWKAIDTGIPEQGHLGIIGKSGEFAVRDLLSIIKSDFSPHTFSSADLTVAAWRYLGIKEYNEAITYATICINLYEKEGKIQQDICRIRSKFPEGKEINNYWALNDVGSCYFIIGIAYFEQRKQEEANAAFEELLENYNYAQAQDWKGNYFKLKEGIIVQKDKLIPLPSFSSAELTQAAWEFLLAQDYNSTLVYAQKCIDFYGEEAKRQQKECSESKRFHKTEKEILGYWTLNDVGTCYFIKIRGLYEQGKMAEAKEVYDEFLANYSYAQVRDLEGNYWKVKSAVRKLYPDLLPGLISVDKKMLVLYSLGTLCLILIRDIISVVKSISRKTLYLLGLKRQEKKLVPKTEVENKSVMDWKDRVIFITLVFGELYLLFNFVGWWFHPIRMEYYIVSFPLFCLLSYVLAYWIIFYLYVWHLLWSMKKPEYMPPEGGLKVAIVTTFIESEPIEMVKNTLIKMKEVRYPHDTFVLDESDNSELKEFCFRRGIVHFTRKDNQRYNQLSSPFQAKTKGGNINAWIDTYGGNYQFVTFLDPDHQPNSEFLDRVLGYFRDPKVSFVQAPHLYKNQKESWIARGAAEQNYYFVGPIQMGLYGSDACVANGSQSTFRMSALESIGGYGVHNADDILTSTRLHAKGWKGVFVPEALAKGLTPSTWDSYLLQQYRWSNSMFDMLFYHYPSLFKHLKLRQIFAYLTLGTFYFFGVSSLLLMLLPIIAVVINQPPINLELFTFLGYFTPFYLMELFILIAWGQKFLIQPKTERGIWWRGGLLFVASNFYVAYAFIRAIFKKGLLRAKFVTPKEAPKGISYLRFFIPHIILVSISIVTLIYSFLLDVYLWPIGGMKLFLTISIVSLTGLIITSTRWFNN